MNGALVIARKEFRETLRNRSLMASMLSMPVVYVLVPVLAFAFVPEKIAGAPIDADFARFLGLPLSATMGAMLVEMFARPWLTLFLIMPVFLPIMLASQSVAGERERRTLEPLLASPVTAREIVLGKSIAAALPGLIITWGTFLLFVPAFDMATWRMVGSARLPDTQWTFAMVFLAPLFALFGNGLAVMTSSLFADARVAQNVAAMVTVPLIGVAIGQLVAKLDVSLVHLISAAFTVAAADVLLFGLMVKAFDRERVLTRWG